MEFEESLQSRIDIEVFAGETVVFMVGTFEGVPPAGLLVFNVTGSGPSLVLDLVVDRVGRISPRSGVVSLHGTLFCSQPAGVELFAGLAQRSRRGLIRGFGFAVIECDGETRWRLLVSGETVRFRGGRAHATVNAVGDGGALAFVERNVWLRGTRPRR